MVDNKKIEEMKQLEYEAQAFGCSSEEVIDFAKSLITYGIRSSINSMVTTLKNHCEGTSTEAINNAGKEAFPAYQKASEKPLQQLQETIKEIFHVPSNIILPEDKSQQHQYSPTDLQKVDNEIDELLSRLDKARYKESILEKECSVASKMLEAMETDFN